MCVLYPLCKHGLQLNCGVREHVLRATQSAHRVIVDVKTKAVESQEDANPVQVRDNRITVPNDTIEQVVVVVGWIIIANHKDSCMGARPNNTEASNPSVVSEQRKLSTIVSC